MEDNPRQHRFTLVFDREAYSPELFAEMQAKRIAVVTYHKYPGEDWPAEEFREQTVELGGGAVVRMKLAERGSRLSNGLWVRQVRKLSAGGKQTAILSTDYVADYTDRKSTRLNSSHLGISYAVFCLKKKKKIKKKLKYNNKTIC